MKVTLSLNTLLIVVLAAFLASCSNGYIKSGDKEYENLSYSKAISKYEKGLRGQPNNLDVKLKLANAHRQLNQSEQAEKYYSQVADSIALPQEQKLHYAQVLMKNNKYDEARPLLESYLEENPTDQLARDLLASTTTVNSLKEDTSAYEMKVLPLDFTVSMFGPIQYENGIVFAGETEITSAASTNPWTGYSFLDMFYMEKDASGVWDIPENFSPELNGRFHDGPATFSEDENTIIYTRSAMKNERKRLVNENNENQFYLYTSTKTDGKWSEPQELPFNDNSFSVGHPSLSKDGKTLYFSSDMPGGYGGSDIYKSNYEDGKWSEPINLGKSVNTPGNEVFPYISKNGTLYFSSEGHRNLGGLDVFMVANNGGVWATPVNLAYPLNTSRDDFAFILNEDDTTGFVSSNRNDVDRIFSFTKVPPVFIVKGMASKKPGNEPMAGVSIKLVNLTDLDSATFVTGKDGKFSFNLLPSKSYKISGTKEGYFTVSKTFETSKQSEKKEIDLVFEIDEIVESESGTGSGNPGDGGTVANKTYDIGNVFYDYNDASIRKDAKPTLNKLVTLLKDNPKISIEIQSHCDSRGGNAFNKELSNRRAASVVKYLTSSGIDPKRLTSKGFGESQPVNNCIDGVECTEAEHQMNRRTEFIVLKKGNS
ncbi:MAG TPA: OmpA family protein [Cryomorphaceae bacterium]|nr:OmpA family protein [Cryomorphaceae bacterium]